MGSHIHSDHAEHKRQCFHPSDLRQVQYHVRRSAAMRQMQHPDIPDTRSLRKWLLRSYQGWVAAGQRAEQARAEARQAKKEGKPRIRRKDEDVVLRPDTWDPVVKALAFEPIEDAMPARYEYEIEFKYRDLSARYITFRAGTVSVVEREEGVRKSKSSYTFWVLGPGGSKKRQLGKEASTKGKVKSRVRWEPQQFIGPLHVTEFEADGTFFTNGGYQWTVDGAGGRAPLSLIKDPATDGKQPKPDSDGKLPKPSFSGFAGSGLIHKLGIKPVTFADPLTDLSFWTTLSAAAEAREFVSGDAVLTPSQRRVIGLFSSTELLRLRRESTQILVTGYTDTKDDHLVNDPLSAMRASNAAQALRDMVGADLSAKLNIKPKGEREAGLYIPDGKDAPEFRKVEVAIDGVTTLRIVGFKPKAKER